MPPPDSASLMLCPSNYCRFSPSVLERRPVAFAITISSQADPQDASEDKGSPKYRARKFLDDDECELVTRQPLWNSEISAWQHNFGTRVKRDSLKNFVVVKDPKYVDVAKEEDYANTTSILNPMHRVCLRHGRVSKLLSRFS